MRASSPSPISKTSALERVSLGQRPFLAVCFSDSGMFTYLPDPYLYWLFMLTYLYRRTSCRTMNFHIFAIAISLLPFHVSSPADVCKVKLIFRCEYQCVNFWEIEIFAYLPLPYLYWLFMLQGCKSRLTFSNPELTQDHVLQARMIWFFQPSRLMP